MVILFFKCGAQSQVKSISSQDYHTGQRDALNDAYGPDLDNQCLGGISRMAHNGMGPRPACGAML